MNGRGREVWSVCIMEPLVAMRVNKLQHTVIGMRPGDNVK